VRPSGDKYLMEDFYYAGGLPGLMSRIRGHLHLDCMTVTGRTLGQELASIPALGDDARSGGGWYGAERIIYSLDRPLRPQGGIAILRGNLAPNGAVVKQTAVSAHLGRHRGRAVVFSSMTDLAARIDDPALDVTADSVLVLQNAGPKGAPGMPEAGGLPIPKKLLAQGVRDMLRISDARMSGTGYGAVVLHVTPEAAVGGPLGLVRDGDWIDFDLSGRKLNVEVDDRELARRKAAWQPPASATQSRGYARMYVDHVLQADQGADFDFLVGGD
jgi:dihydroxy-acid dehydratase